MKNNNNKYIDYIDLCNKPLNDSILLEAIWQEVAMRIYLKFYSGLLGFQSNKSNFSFVKKLYILLRSYLKENSNHENNNANHIRYHLFSCETHRQSIKTALGLLTNEIVDLRTSESSMLVDKLYKL